MGDSSSKPEKPEEPESVTESYEDIKARLLESGRLFEDDDFPAKQSSIFYKQERGRGDADWKRPFVSLQMF